MILTKVAACCCSAQNNAMGHERTHALKKSSARPRPQGQTCSPDFDRLSIQLSKIADATPGVHRGAAHSSGI
jgi:hypothetical protein